MWIVSQIPPQTLMRFAPPIYILGLLLLIAVALTTFGLAKAAPTLLSQLAAGTSVQKVASALRALQATATEIAAIFGALRDAGAISAEVVVR